MDEQLENLIPYRIGVMEGKRKILKQAIEALTLILEQSDNEAKEEIKKMDKELGYGQENNDSIN